MINHARTLLANLDRREGELGEEHIPAAFVPLKLSGGLAFVRTLLYGRSPDRFLTNHRTARFMACLRATELHDDLLDLDSRVLYEDQDLSNPLLYLPTANRPGFSHVGNPESPDASGACRHSLSIAVSGSEVVVSSGFQSWNLDLAVSSGLSGTMPLGQTGYEFRLTDPQDGDSWFVETVNRPTKTLAAIAESFATAGETTLLSLFGPAPSGPYAAYKALWTSHPEFAYRFGGLLAAFIRRCEEIRIG